MKDETPRPPEGDSADAADDAAVEEKLGIGRGGTITAGEILARIRDISRDEAEKGRMFEYLARRLLLSEPSFEIEEVWAWNNWPGREGPDIGTDLVARRASGRLVAVQCKCLDDETPLPKGGIEKFLGGSQGGEFDERMIVATCRWGPNALQAIKGANPPVQRIDFHEWSDVPIVEDDEDTEVRGGQQLLPLQDLAFQDVTDPENGLPAHGRGKLIMACGTGKTFTSQRIAEELVPDGGAILFCVPSIALASQARRDWLRHTRRPLRSVVVCSDATAGGRGETDTMKTYDLECPATTDPERIASEMRDDDGRTKVVFATYHSVTRVIEAQEKHGAPEFGLAIADEAHRTTGAVLEGEKPRKVDFQAFHDQTRLKSRMRLYMTATPRAYTETSKANRAKEGIKTVDMEDEEVYGPVLHHLKFSTAVDKGMLSDYRVIVLGRQDYEISEKMRARLAALGEGGRNPPGIGEMLQVLGVSLAINGALKSEDGETAPILRRVLAFANSIERSKWFKDAFMDTEVLKATTRRARRYDSPDADAALKVRARHLDAKSNARDRGNALQELRDAVKTGECRIVTNVKLFSEGVDVRELDAVAFLDPRDSKVDVVQAVGRVMRKAEGKEFGYIIIPAVLGGDGELDGLDSTGYRTVGRVLRALQAHDERLGKDPARFVKVYVPPNRPPAPPDRPPIQDELPMSLEEADPGIFARIVKSARMRKQGEMTAATIEDAVKHAADRLLKAGYAENLAGAMGMSTDGEGGQREVCVVAALVLANACMLQRRLYKTSGMEDLADLGMIGRSQRPYADLIASWERILEKDYRPAFQPALDVARILQGDQDAIKAVRGLAACANRVADSLSELGYDHAGPLYHRILRTGKSDGAYYTNNVSAMLLARLALDKSLIDWSDRKRVEALRIMDPACGTGTLLMAAAAVIKDRVADAGGEGGANLHQRLVEDALCGLDINRHAVQLAACNLTLGAPTVEYRRMNLATMPHGPGDYDGVRAGSLELLAAADDTEIGALVSPPRDIDAMEAEQVDEAGSIGFPVKNLDMVIMNPPFSSNMNRGRKFSEEITNAMQKREGELKAGLTARDRAAGEMTTTNVIRGFFTPLADRLLAPEQGTMATVMPAIACTGADGLPELRFLAERFHIERVVTTHDPNNIAFSGKTGKHECMLICRRLDQSPPPPTEFVALRRMPETPKEATELADAIAAGAWEKVGRVCIWPAERVRDGNWTPAQWYDPSIAEIAHELETRPGLVPADEILSFGATGQAVRDVFRILPNGESAVDPVMVFGSVSAKNLRKTMSGDPEQPREPRKTGDRRVARVLSTAGHLMLANKHRITNGLVTALCSERASVGSGWIPATGQTRDVEKGICAWWNSTPGRLLLLNHRANTLTYVHFSKGFLQAIPVPPVDRLPLLTAAWEAHRDTDLLPLRDGDSCPVRLALDEAAAAAIDEDPAVVADWRRWLAAEPTISGKMAPDPAEGDDETADAA